MDSSSQSAKILKLIKKRNRYGTPNHELARISLKYSSRIAELRKEGHPIIAERVYNGTRATGTWLYRIVEDPEHTSLLTKLKTLGFKVAK